eukprot:TCONS_00001987-protein
MDWSFFNPKSEEFFAAIVKKAMIDRQESGSKRNDFIDIFIDILKKGLAIEDGTRPSETGEATLKENSTANDSETTLKKEEIEKLIIANSLLMFFAGFDTLSSASSIMLYFLAMHPEYQEKLYQEIKEAAESNGSDQLDYATIMGLSYMEKFFQESFRMYPLTHLERASVNDFKIPDTDMVIPKDVYVLIASSAFVKDEKYFPNPTVFDPENFAPEMKAARHPFVSGGFGHGPRNCIAQRFATMEVKIIMSRILMKYRVLKCDKTVEKLIPDPTSMSQDPIGSVWFTVEKR